jgi:hypothetical protein
MAKEMDRLASIEKKSKSQLFRDMLTLYEETMAERQWRNVRQAGRQTARRKHGGRHRQAYS